MTIIMPICLSQYNTNNNVVILTVVICQVIVSLIQSVQHGGHTLGYSLE